ncbi:hypothetical protein F5X98DRAFT_61889 [Xylaria grammica]|nr:hypothetical protein F5X98DRAFT_61889 [Xylaria grammica]
MGTNNEILGWNGLEITGKLRPNASDVASLGPDFEAEWSQTFANNPNKPMVGLTLVAASVPHKQNKSKKKRVYLILTDLSPFLACLTDLAGFRT